MEKEEVSSTDLYEDVLKSQKEYLGLCASLIQHCKTLFEDVVPEDGIEAITAELPTAACACDGPSTLDESEINKLQKESDLEMEAIKAEPPTTAPSCNELNEDAVVTVEMKAKRRKSLWKRLFNALSSKRQKRKKQLGQ